MADPNVIVLSDYSNLSVGAIKGRLGRTSAKTGERGRARVSVEIQAEPIAHVFDDLMLGKGPSEAIARVYRRKVEGVTEQASDSTLATRKYQAAAWERGETWATQRFAGGRIGAMPPRVGEARLFNYSGRFARSIVATENRTERSWTVNVAANRLDPRTSRSAAEFAQITETLIRVIPEFGSPHRLAEDPEVIAAIDAAVAQQLLSAETMNADLRAALGKVRSDLAMRVVRGAVSVVLG